jgi:hypothetical protein
VAASMLFAFGFILPILGNADDFSIDPGRSTLVVSGSLSGQPITAQGTGALSTTYSGMLNVAFAPGTLEFTGAVATAGISGNWQPAIGGTTGSAPANYGPKVELGIATAVGAIRNLVLVLLSDPISLSGTSFDASEVSLSTTSGAFDYNAGFFGSGSESLAGASAFNQMTNGSLTLSGNLQTLTIPVQYTSQFTLFTPNDAVLTLSGSIVATRAVPEPAPCLLTGVGFLLTLRRFRFRSDATLSAADSHQT